jgi:3-phosphoshikimate 1-carboxyvinyltransferase
MKWCVQPSSLGGAARVPGDKSIAHRALMLAGLARGTSLIKNVPAGEDVLSTAACMSRLGARVEMSAGTAHVQSDDGISAPNQELDAGNSGTTMRLLTGMLAGQDFSSRLTGDASLRRRPMGRVVDPLRQMGASIGTRDGSAPLDITGAALHGIRYTLPVASAQVKSAILLAGLFASGTTTVVEIVPARDHTERMLAALGLRITRTGQSVEVERGETPNAFTLTVPGDISSAAFLFAAAALTGGEVTIASVGSNPTRSAILGVLERMGADVSVSEERSEAGEPRGTITVGGHIERPIHLCAQDVPGLVDELPLVALLATHAAGDSVVEGASELRVKETDRIAAVAQELRTMGADIEERPDGWRIRGRTPLHGGEVWSHGDHRLAMLLAIAGASASGETVIADAEASAVSFPDFASVFTSLGGAIEEH